MHKKLLVFCLLLVVSAGCKRSAPVQPATGSEAQASPKQESSASQFDACALITNQEVETIVGSPVKETKPSERSDAGMRFSQCFYTAEEFSKSVNLSVTQNDPGVTGKRSVKEFWKETFKRDEEEKKEGKDDQEKKKSLSEQKGDKEEEEKSVPPKKIDGVGEEAFWVGGRVGGALYVLQKNAFIRVSVGGADTEESKIEKSKALAGKAVGRL